MSGKPTVTELGIDVDAQRWQRSGDGPGAIEVAFTRSRASGPQRAADSAERTGASAPSGPSEGPQGAAAEWVLMRVADDPSGRVLVYDRNEWECFLDGVRNGEFDDAAG